MPRNGSGTYTLPQAPFVPGTTISSSAVNADLSDIANALTGSVSADGQTSLTGSLNFPPGSPTAPSVTFNSDTSSGLYSPGAGKVGIAAGGTPAVVIDSTVENTGNGNIFQYGNGALLNPVGAVIDFAGTIAPTGWLLCYGQTLSTTAYPELYLVIGTTYGSGIGTFNLPDLRGRGTYGRDNMGGTTAGRVTVAGTNFDGTVLGGAGGGQDQILGKPNLPNTTFTVTGTGSGNTPIPANTLNHTHTFTGQTAGINVAGGGTNVIQVAGTTTTSQYVQNALSLNTSVTTLTANAASGGTDLPFSTLSPALILNKIIFAWEAIMPFSGGVFTPVVGAENAAPGQVIRSATWNAIFTDIAAALTQLAQNQIINPPSSVSSSGGYIMLTTDTLILVVGNTPTILLPDSVTKTSPVTIVGANTGIFSVNNTALLTTNSQEIDGLASGAVVLSTDYQAITLVPLASGGWVTI